MRRSAVGSLFVIEGNGKGEDEEVEVVSDEQRFGSERPVGFNMVLQNEVVF